MVVAVDFCIRDKRFEDIEIFHRNPHLPIESGSHAFKGSTGMEGLLVETGDKLELEMRENEVDNVLQSKA